MLKGRGIENIKIFYEQEITLVVHEAVAGEGPVLTGHIGLVKDIVDLDDDLFIFPFS